MAKHTRQNRFAGTAYMKQRLRRGGEQGVTERDIIALDGCWCGEALGHDWPGKDKGAPHPREEKEDHMAEHQPITRNDMREFSKVTQDLLLEIVNDFKVRCRIIDGGHLMLYPPDGTSRPFKVSSERQDKVNKQILEHQFMHEYGLVRKKPEKKEQPVKAAVVETPPTYEIPEAATPVEEPVVEESTDHADAMRAAIAVLTEALQISDLETEALAALDENEALKKHVAGLAGDLRRAKSVAEAADRETKRLAEENTRLSFLLDEAVASRDVAVEKWRKFREFLDE